MKTCFIHHSDYPLKHLIERYNNTDIFYWLTDRYFDQLTFGRYAAYKYLYFYINDSDKFVSMSKQAQNSLTEPYLTFKKWATDRENGIKTQSFYEEPPILVSSNEIEPNLIAEYDKSAKDFFVIYPAKQKGIRLNLFDKNGYAKSFLDTRLRDFFSEIIEMI